MELAGGWEGPGAPPDGSACLPAASTRCSSLSSRRPTTSGTTGRPRATASECACWSSAGGSRLNPWWLPNSRPPSKPLRTRPSPLSSPALPPPSPAPPPRAPPSVPAAGAARSTHSPVHLGARRLCWPPLALSPRRAGTFSTLLPGRPGRVQRPQEQGAGRGGCGPFDTWHWGHLPVWLAPPSPASTCSPHSFFLRLCSEVPILEDTLMRILVIGLSRELPLGPADAMELADHLVKRAAAVQADGKGPSGLVLAQWAPAARQGLSLRSAPPARCAATPSSPARSLDRLRRHPVSACLRFPRWLLVPVSPPSIPASGSRPVLLLLVPWPDPGPRCPLTGSGPCLSDVEVLKVERVQLLDAVLNLCTYHHPENIQLPPG